MDTNCTWVAMFGSFQGLIKPTIISNVLVFCNKMFPCVSDCIVCTVYNSKWCFKTTYCKMGFNLLIFLFPYEMTDLEMASLSPPFVCCTCVCALICHYAGIWAGCTEQTFQSVPNSWSGVHFGIHSGSEIMYQYLTNRQNLLKPIANFPNSNGVSPFGLLALITAVKRLSSFHKIVTTAEKQKQPVHESTI